METDTIICGRAESVLQGFPGESVDLWLTSPPYDGLRAYDGYTFDFEAIAAELWRVTKPGGVGVWVVADETRNGSESGTSFRQALGFMERGFKLHDTMIYRCLNTGAKGSNDAYWQEFEYMFVFTKGRIKTVNRLADKKNLSAGQSRQKHTRIEGISINDINKPVYRVQEYGIRGNVWTYHSGNNGDGKDDPHPAPFPERLAEDHILSWSNPGDLVLDPMCGSGTTCKMAIRHHRHFIGIDISPRYCDLARRRIGAVQPVFEEFA